jgi:uncharacterized membrane protein YfcA
MDLGVLSLPAEMSAWVFASLLVASFATSFMTVALGIGGGALLLAILAALMPPAALIPVHGVVQLGSNLFRMAMLRASVRWTALPAFAVGSIIGCFLGGLVVVELPSAAVQIGVGLFVIYSVASKPPKWLSRWPWLAGGISSFLTMFFGATGPFVASFTKSLRLDRHAHVATHAALMTVQHLLKVVVFGILGFAFGPWLAVIIAMVLSGVGGTYAGRLMLNRLSNHNFHKALNIVLLLISAHLIWAGLYDL